MIKKGFMLVLVAMIFIVSSCNGLNEGQLSPQQSGDPQVPYTYEDREKQDALEQAQPEPDEAFNVMVNVNGNDLDEITIYQFDEHTYIPFLSVLEYMDYRIVEDDESIRAGFTDVLHEVIKGTDRVIVKNEEISLSTPIMTYDRRYFITTNAFQELLGMQSDVRIDEKLHIRTEIEDEDFPQNDKISEIKEIDMEGEGEHVPALSRGKANDIIRTARRFRGTPYLFGARTGRTDVFDCSSFTQYVFGVNGVTIPRNSRQQAGLRQTNRAQYIPVSQLRPGDLLFFYWPGRFQSNRVVGHVSIYMGNGYVIHATPSRGVHIANVANSSYWRRTYLGGVRVRG